jgi:hypothetical protein
MLTSRYSQRVSAWKTDIQGVFSMNHSVVIGRQFILDRRNGQVHVRQVSDIPWLVQIPVKRSNQRRRCMHVQKVVGAFPQNGPQYRIRLNFTHGKNDDGDQ